MEEARSLYCVIPGRVMDDDTLRQSGKLLYGELSALAKSEGYCWASNAYLAQRMKLSPKTVEALLRQLRDRGHIQIEVERDPDTNEVLRRKIWIYGPPGSSVPPPLKNEGRSPQNRGDPPLKNEEENNINRELNINIPPKAPQGGRRASKYDLAEDAKPLLRAYCGDDMELARALADLIDVRREKKAVNSKRGIKALLGQLDDLSQGDRQCKLLLLRQSTANSWKSVFPLKGVSGPAPRAHDRIQEEEGTYLL